LHEKYGSIASACRHGEGWYDPIFSFCMHIIMKQRHEILTPCSLHTCEADKQLTKNWIWSSEIILFGPSHIGSFLGSWSLVTNIPKIINMFASSVIFLFGIQRVISFEQTWRTLMNTARGYHEYWLAIKNTYNKPWMNSLTYSLMYHPLCALLV
jgi:hypothetical protein